MRMTTSNQTPASIISPDASRGVPASTMIRKQAPRFITHRKNQFTINSCSQEQPLVGSNVEEREIQYAGNTNH